MKATKGNKVYTIDESQKKQYQDAGFDIIDDDGKVLAHGRGKTVSFDAYEALQKENEALKERLKTAEKKVKSEKKENPKEDPKKEEKEAEVKEGE